MKLPVEPEPLPEERWNAIEHDLFARLDAQTAPLARERKAPWGWLAAAAVLLLAIGALSYRTFLAHDRVAQPTTTPSPATHMTAGDSTLDLAQGSVVSVHGDDQRGIVVNLDRGSVDFEVAPRKERPPYVVETPHARVEVVGTHFRVEVRDSSTRVSVTTGVVRVLANGGERTVAGGQSIGSDEIASEPSLAVSALPKAVDAPSAKPLSERQRFELAESLERSDPDRAIATYDGLARGHGTWADNALFAEARLQADRGKTAEARKLLDAYLQRSPHGPNADDARALLDRLGP